MTLTDRPELRVCPQCEAQTTARTCPHDGHATVKPSELAARRVDDPMLGSDVDGKYQVEARIGVGSMGTVYRAVNLRTGAPVALKVMHAALAESGAAVRRFLLEAQNASKLDNPHIVRVLDRGETPQGLPFLVMEHVDGQTLEALLEAGPLPPARVVSIAMQMVKGLGAAHMRGLVHRDVKPENVMLVNVFGEELHVKLLDFGIARAASERGAGTMVLGTPRYMAPEQWSAQAAIDARSDLYSLGCVLYHMIAGRPPFVIETPDERRLVQMYQSAHVTQLPPPLPLPGLSPLSLLVDDLLRKDAAQRPASAEEVLKRLRAMERDPASAPPPAERRVAPRPAATNVLAATPETNHSALLMPTMLLTVDAEEAATDEQRVPGARGPAEEPERTLLLDDDEDAPTRALMSPGRLLAMAPALAGPKTIETGDEPPPENEPEDGPTIARVLEVPAIAAPAAAPAPVRPERTPSPPAARPRAVESQAPPLPSDPESPTRRAPKSPPKAAPTKRPPPPDDAPPKRGTDITLPGQVQPTVHRPWMKWVIGTLLAVVVGVVLGVVLAGRA